MKTLYSLESDAVKLNNLCHSWAYPVREAGKSFLGDIISDINSNFNHMIEKKDRKSKRITTWPTQNVSEGSQYAFSCQTQSKITIIKKIILSQSNK